MALTDLEIKEEETAAASGTGKKDETGRGDRNKAVDILTLRRTAGEVKRHKVIVRVISVLVIILIALVALTYAISYFYDKFGSFTVMVNKYDMINQGLTLSETPGYDRTISVLNADIIYDMTNISGEDLPDNVDKINGTHNGENFIAYTFYLINSGNDTVAYKGEMTMGNITLVLWQFIESYDKVGYEINVADEARKPEQKYTDDLYDLAALNLLLFRAYTKGGAKQAEVLKSRSSRAASPKIVRRLDDINTDEYDLAVGRETGEPYMEEYTCPLELPADADEILAEIDRIIEIETEFFKAEEQKRLEAEVIDLNTNFCIYITMIIITKQTVFRISKPV